MTKKPHSALMEVLEKANATHLLGEIVAAELIDAIENPDLAREIAEFSNSDEGEFFRKISRKNRRQRKPTVQV